jgi:hypothetical protein
MIIYNQQLEILSGQVLVAFENYSIGYLRKKFPLSTKNMDTEILRGLVKEGITKTSEYDIDDRMDVLQYLEYMICFGRDFDVNPDTNWASRILWTINISGSEKIKRLLQIQTPRQESPYV